MRHFLNNIEIAPRNLQDIGVISDFTERENVLSLNVDKIILPREAKSIIDTHIQTQGIFEGIPYRIEMEGGINLDYYVDLIEGAEYRQYETEVKIFKRLGKDSFMSKANGSSFESLVARGVVYNLDTIKYVIVPENQIELGVTLSVTAFSLTKELIDAAERLAYSIIEVIQAYTPNAGFVSVDTGDIIAMWLKLAARIIYVAALLVALVNLGKKIFELIFPTVREYLGCKVKELISKSCIYWGYSLQSTLLDSLPGLCLLPVPIQKQKKSIFDFIQNDLTTSFTKGYPTSQDTTSSVGELITAIEDMFNARTRVNNGVVEIERRDYWQNQSSIDLVPALALQDKRQSSYSYNTEDIWKRYYIHYQLDFSDIHTIDEPDFYDAEYSTEALNVVNPDLINIKGLHDVNIPFAMGSRKEDYNFTEKAALIVFETIDQVTGILGGGTNFANKVEDRLGVLEISQQFFSITKMLYIIGPKQPTNYDLFISASQLWQGYHSINQIQLNDYKVKSEIRTRIRTEDFVNLLTNNYANINGVMCEILNMEWIDEKSFAIITYKEPDDYASNKVTTIVIND